MKITDHRARSCRVDVPAQIIVEEMHDSEFGASTTTRYSDDE